MTETILAGAASSWAVLMGIAPVLQIRRMLREQSSRQVSVGYFTILLIGFLLWIAYGAAAGIPALVIPNTVALLVGATAVIVALRLRRRPPPGQRPVRRERSACRPENGSPAGGGMA
jgi:uncharacterized protein with PQ loop repeat